MSGKKSDENSVKKSDKEIGQKIGQTIRKNRTREIGHLCSNPVRTVFFFWMGGGGRLTLTVTDPKVPF